MHVCGSGSILHHGVSLPGYQEYTIFSEQDHSQSTEVLIAGFSPSFYYHINLLSQCFLVFHVGHTPHATVLHTTCTHPIQHGSGYSACSLAISLLFHVYCPFLADPGRRKATTGILHYSVFSSLIALLGPSLFPSTSL